MVIEVIHQGRPNVPKKELQQKLAQMYKVEDPNQVTVFHMHTQFGGGRSKGVALIYDNLAATKKYEPKYRQIRNGIITKTATSRKQRKERKNRAKKIRGVKKHKSAAEGKKGKK